MTIEIPRLTKEEIERIRADIRKKPEFVELDRQIKELKAINAIFTGKAHPTKTA